MCFLIQGMQAGQCSSKLVSRAGIYSGLSRMDVILIPFPSFPGGGDGFGVLPGRSPSPHS